MTSKQALRKQIKELKTNISSSQCAEEALMVKNLIEGLQCFINAQNILTYYSLPDELDTKCQLNDWHQNKNIFLPKVNGSNLDIIRYAPSQIEIGAYNTFEPIGPTIDPAKIDLAIIPGVAFDKNGNRMGRGKGYYDRFLLNCNTIKIGICFDFQLFDTIPNEPHDIKMDAIITNNHTLIFNSHSSWL